MNIYPMIVTFACATLLQSAHSFAGNPEAQIKLDKSPTELSTKVNIPGLPHGWRRPDEKELFHFMRPKNSRPNYMLNVDLDGDHKSDWAIIAVKNDHSHTAVIVYLSSLEGWRLIEGTRFESATVIGTLSAKSGLPNKVVYGKIGGHSSIYEWSKVLKEFSLAKKGD